MVGVGGFEPPTSRSRTVRSSLTELHPDRGNAIVYDMRERKASVERVLSFRAAAAPGPVGRAEKLGIKL